MPLPFILALRGVEHEDVCVIFVIRRSRVAVIRRAPALGRAVAIRPTEVASIITDLVYPGHVVVGEIASR